MKPKSLITRLGFSLLAGLLSLSVLAQNTLVINDPQEITDFLSGYDVKSVTFTIDENDVLTIAIEPYGVPGDADGDGNPDASSNPAIFDEPGVGSTEFLNIGLVCADPTVCIPDVNFQYTADTLVVDNPLAGPASMAIAGDAYVLTIPDWSVFKANVGGTSTSFGAFSFSASFTDLQPDDFAPDLDPVLDLLDLVGRIRDHSVLAEHLRHDGRDALRHDDVGTDVEPVLRQHGRMFVAGRLGLDPRLAVLRLHGRPLRSDSQPRSAGR